MAEFEQGETLVDEVFFIMTLGDDLEDLLDQVQLDYYHRGVFVLAEVVEDADSCTDVLLFIAGWEDLSHDLSELSLVYKLLSVLLLGNGLQVFQSSQGHVIIRY